MNYGIDSIHPYSVIAIKVSLSHVSVSGLRCLSASINHKSRKKISPIRDSYVVYLGQTYGPNNSLLYIIVLECLIISSVHTAEPSIMHIAGDMV